MNRLRASAIVASLIVAGCAAPPDAELVCTTSVDGCTCASIGCPCADDGQCLDGTCNEYSNTCVLIEDDMVYVPQGKFWMGCREGVDTDELTGPCPEDELPYREVTLDAYWIDRLEVGKGDYRACMDAGACTVPNAWDGEDYEGVPPDGQQLPGTDEFPVGSASWSQAFAYCEWVGKRLPTEAEWEKAARGVDGRKYPWGNDAPTCELANYSSNGDPCPHDAEDRWLTWRGRFPAGTAPFGALDMAGNVLEWTNDGKEPGIGYETLPAENPTGIESENGRVVRGSGYQSAVFAAGGYILRTSLRLAGQISWTTLSLDHGIRCAKDAP